MKPAALLSAVSVFGLKMDGNISIKSPMDHAAAFTYYYLQD